jgi:uncharacterized protein (DUF1697 family)
MSIYVAFIRAINIAGHARLKMSVVRDAFTAAGCRKVRTYIQSGNVIFESSTQELANLHQQICGQLRSVLDAESEIVLRSARSVLELVEQAPFKDVEAKPGTKLYVAFLFQRPRIKPRFPLVSRKEALEAIAMSGQNVFVVSRRKENGFFGFPNNFVEKELSVSATSRNWSTVKRISQLLLTKTGNTVPNASPAVGL